MRERKCPTPGKLAFNTRGLAYDYLRYDQHRRTLRIYECACGKFHITHDTNYSFKIKNKRRCR